MTENVNVNQNLHTVNELQILINDITSRNWEVRDAKVSKTMNHLFDDWTGRPTAIDSMDVEIKLKLVPLGK